MISKFPAGAQLWSSCQPEWHLKKLSAHPAEFRVTLAYINPVLGRRYVPSALSQLKRMTPGGRGAVVGECMEPAGGFGFHLHATVSKTWGHHLWEAESQGPSTDRLSRLIPSPVRGGGWGGHQALTRCSVTSTTPPLISQQISVNCRQSNATQHMAERSLLCAFTPQVS